MSNDIDGGDGRAEVCEGQLSAELHGGAADGRLGRMVWYGEVFSFRSLAQMRGGDFRGELGGGRVIGELE